MLRRFALVLLPASMLSTGVAGSIAIAAGAETASSAGQATQSGALQWQPRWQFRRPQFQRPQFRRPQFQRPAGGVPFNPAAFMPRPRPFIAPKFDASRFAPKPIPLPRYEYDQYGRRWSGNGYFRSLHPQDTFRSGGSEPPKFYPWNQPGVGRRR